VINGCIATSHLLVAVSTAPTIAIKYLQPNLSMFIIVTALIAVRSYARVECFNDCLMLRASACLSR
jgi:hypothetical protein